MNICMTSFWMHNIPDNPVVLTFFLILLIFCTHILMHLETKAQENTLALSHPEIRPEFSLWMYSLTTME